VVVNLSLGSYGGSHDGTSVLESKFDELLKAKPGRALVIAAGNGIKSETHTSGTVIQAEEPYVIEWFIPSLTNRIVDFRQELEIWYDGSSALQVEVFAPDGRSLGVSRLGSPPLSSEILEDTQTPKWIIYHTRPDLVPGEDENHINILVDDRRRETNGEPAAAEDDFDVKGTWRLELSHDLELGGNANVNFHAWIERNDYCQSKFRNNSKQEYTLNSIGNAELPIVVSSFDYLSSRSGPSRNKKNGEKPELNAPGLNIFAARAAHDGNTQLSGTSMAAPHVAGVIALMFQAALERRNPSKLLSIHDIRSILIDSANRTTSGNNHNLILGFGRVDATEAIKRVIGNQ
jgi:subtilisin family serine protease